MEDIVLIGFGGHAKSVIDTIERLNQYRIVGLLEKQENAEREYRGYRVIGDDEMLKQLFVDGVKNAFVAIGYMGNSHVRNFIYDSLKQIGFILPVIIDPSASISMDVQLGEGTFVGKRAVINAGASVGKMSIINTGAILEHEVMVSDFCHIAVGSILCGQTVVEDNVFVGAGAVVIQGKHLGKESMIGAGTVVAKNISEKTLLYGNVMKKIEKE